MTKRWIKRIAWIALLLVVSILPAHFARVPGAVVDDGTRTGGVWVVRGIVLTLAALGIVLACATKKRQGWH